MGSAGLGGDGTIRCLRTSLELGKPSWRDKQEPLEGCRRQEIPKDSVGGRPFLVAMPEVPVVQDLQDNIPGSSTIVGRF